MRSIARSRSSAFGAALFLALVVVPTEPFSASRRRAGRLFRHASICDRIRSSSFIKQASWASRGIIALDRDDGCHRSPSNLQSTSSSASDVAVLQSTEDLNDAISTIIRDSSSFGDLDGALQLLDQAEESLMEGRTDFPRPNRATYSNILTALAALSDEEICSSNKKVVDKIEDLFSRMKRVAQQHPEYAPTRVDYNAVILAQSKTYRNAAAQRCDQLLTELWSEYNATTTNDSSDFLDNGIQNPYCPSHSTYISTLTALARSGGGRRAAARAEALLEEMEHFSRQDALAHLKPTTTCVNIVL